MLNCSLNSASYNYFLKEYILTSKPILKVIKTIIKNKENAIKNFSAKLNYYHQLAISKLF
jgi:hypothetical protein